MKPFQVFYKNHSESKRYKTEKLVANTQSANGVSKTIIS